MCGGAMERCSRETVRRRERMEGGWRGLSVCGFVSYWLDGWQGSCKGYFTCEECVE